MGVVTIQLSEELTGAIARRATELNVDMARFVAAIIREKLNMPVAIGDLEVFVPADISDFEMERAPGESDENFETAKAMYGALFAAALR